MRSVYWLVGHRDECKLRSIASLITMSVSLSVCLHISKTTRPNFTKYLCTLTVVVVRSSSGGLAIRYILPVLWTTPQFYYVDHMRCRLYVFLSSERA